MFLCFQGGSREFETRKQEVSVLNHCQSFHYGLSDTDMVRCAWGATLPVPSFISVSVAPCLLPSVLHSLMLFPDPHWQPPFCK